MKKYFLFIVSLVGLSNSVVAEEIAAPRTDRVLPPTPTNWTGFYLGMNAGYDWDAFSSSSAGGFNSALSTWNPSGIPNSGSGQTAANFLAALGSGTTPTPASGFIGGLQAGYNYQVNRNFVAGFEIDFQGSTARGQGTISNASGWGNSFGPYSGTFNVPYNVYSDGTPDYWQVTPGGNATVPTTIYIPYTLSGSGSYNVSGSAITTVTKRMNSLGTVRARLGYLITPELLAYATGGLAYGNVSVNTSNAQLMNGNLNASGAWSTTDPGVNACSGPNPHNCGLTDFSGSRALSFPIGGASNGRNFYASTKVGWTVGGGLEWMLTKNWSIKGEYLYYSLGSIRTRGGYTFLFNQQNNAIQAVVSQATSTTFGGHIARLGLNYHLDFDPSH